MSTSGTFQGRVAVLGGGVAGAAAALAFLQISRMRGRPAQVKLYRGDARHRRSLAPAVLGPECRSRLAGLGVGVSRERRVEEILAVEVHSGRATEVLRAPAAGLWVLDGWGRGEPGQQILSAAITSAAERAGAEISPLRPESVERLPPQPAAARVAPGELVVRAGGRAERFGAVVLATGVSERWGDRFFPGFGGAPALPACEARLRFQVVHPLASRVIRLVLAPLEGVDGLYLVPAGSTVYALAYGPGAGASELCQALMAAARDRLLPRSFEIAAMRPTAVPSGAGRRLVAHGRLAVGTTAHGHPLQLGLSETLAGCTRAAVALAEGAWDKGDLERQYVQDGLGDLLLNADAGARSVRWLTRAHERGARAVGRALRSCGDLGTRNPFATGILGLGAPSPEALLPPAVWEGLLSGASRLIRGEVDRFPPDLPPCEPNLYYVVDDDDQARDALAQFLESQGAEVVSFSSELPLYAAVARRPPAAVLLDVVLRWVDGLRLCRGLKQHPLTRRTRVFVMSGLDLPHVREGALAAGAEAFLPKPLSPQVLRRLLAANHELRPRAFTAAAAAAAPGTAAG